MKSEYSFLWALRQVARAAKLQGASKIIGVDLNPGKEELGSLVI